MGLMMGRWRRLGGWTGRGSNCWIYVSFGVIVAENLLTEVGVLAVLGKN